MIQVSDVLSCKEIKSTLNNFLILNCKKYCVECYARSEIIFHWLQLVCVEVT